MSNSVIPSFKYKKEQNRRKLIYRDEAIQLLSDTDEITEETAALLYKLDCLECALHDVSNPKSVNCRDNPYCINRLGLEKFQKLLKEEQQAVEKVAEEQTRRSVNESPCGLVNSGNFCYVNSFLQVWFNEPVFRQIIYNWRPSPDYQRPLPPSMDVETVMSSLQQLFYILQTTPFDDTDVNNHFIKSLRLGNEQQDAQEFSIMLFEALDRNLPKHPNGENTRVAIKQLYAGSGRERIWCKCGRKDNFTDIPCSSLQLNIEGHKSLVSALTAHFAAESLDDYCCDMCGKRGQVQRQTSTVALPNVLLLQLNRYVFDNSGNNRKLKTSISYPRELSAAVLSPVAPSAKKQDDVYDLFAVMIHEGDNTHCGHYYDLVKNPISGKWYKYNDEVVELLQKSPGSGKDVTNTRPTADTKACYGLVYRRRSTSSASHPIEFTLPPDEICKKWKDETESRFIGQTNDEIRKSQEKCREVKKRFESLNVLFESLKTNVDKAKKHRNIAYLPTTLIMDVLAKEFQRASADSTSASPAKNNKVVAEASSDTDGNVDIVTLPSESPCNGVENKPKARRGRPRANQIPLEQISHRLGIHGMPICCHGGVKIESVLYGDVKAVNRQAAETLLARYAVTVSQIKEHVEGEPPVVIKKHHPMLTAEQICVDCVKMLKRESEYVKQLENTTKLAASIMKDKKRCSVLGTLPKPAGYLYVAKKTLKDYKRLAKRDMEYQEKVMESEQTVLMFSTNVNGMSAVPPVPGSRVVEAEKNSSQPPAPEGNSKINGDGYGAGRLRKRDGSEAPNTETVAKKMKEDQQRQDEVGVSDDVSRTLESVVACVAPLLDKYGNKGEDTTPIDNENMNDDEMAVLTRPTTPAETDGGQAADVRDWSTPSGERPSSSRSNGSNEAAVDFNEDLKCPHGGLNTNEFRMAVSPDEWRQLAANFTNSYKVPCDTPLCEDCLALEQMAQTGKEELKGTIRELMGDFGEFSRMVEKRQVEASQLGTVYTHGICSEFMIKLRGVLRRVRDHSTIPPLCQECVTCLHGRPFKNIEGDANCIDNDVQIVPLREEEWNSLVERWTTIYPDQFATPIKILLSGMPEDMCDSCYGADVESANMRKFHYEKAPIYVKLQSELGEEASTASTSTKPTRRTQNKGLIKLKMNSDDTVKELKVKLYKETQQSPNDQLLYSGQGDGGRMLEDTESLFDARIEPNNSEKPLILIVQSYQMSPTKYNEERAPERGFIDTALAH